jgi:integrase
MVRFASPAPAWKINLSKILSQQEIDAVIADLTPKSQRNHQAMVKLIIFRLSVFCGIRASELAGLNIEDAALNADLAVIRVRAEIAKGGKEREVPIFSAATVRDLKLWKAYRIDNGAVNTDPFVCSVTADTYGYRFSRFSIRNRFRAACKALGTERMKNVTVHDGRHTCASMSLHKGVPLALVRDFLGHSSICITNTYCGLFRDGKGLAFNID